MRKCVALLLLAAVGCGAPPSAPKAPSAPPVPVVDAWLVGTNDPHAETPALLWNGKIGIRLGRYPGMGTAEGTGFFSADEFETTGEEKIRRLPNPVRVVVKDGLHRLSGRGEKYEQRLDMRNGVLLTTWTEPIEGGSVRVRCETVMHPTKRMLAQRWSLTPDHDTSLTVAYSADAAIEFGEKISESGGNQAHKFGALGPSQTPWTVRFDEVSGVERTAAGSTTKKGETYVCEAVWSFGSSLNALEMDFTRSNRRVKPVAGWNLPPAATDFNSVYQDSLETWRKRWQTDIEIDGPVEDQQAVRSFLFYIRSGIDPKGLMAISPYGLSDEKYNGHVFWDADIWVFPALALIDPAAARAITDYRLDTFAQSYATSRSGRSGNTIWRARERGKGDATHPNETGGRPGIVQFPWESSVSGKETAPVMRDEIHITGSVSWQLWQAASLGLADRRKVREILNGADAFFRSRAERRPDGTLELRHVVSPDENHTGDNDLYTNLLAQWLANGGTWTSKGAPRYYLPRDSESFLTYDGDRFRGYKQAAAVLSIYPLQYPPAEKEARAMMKRFADQVSENGPAMTDSVHATIWARLGESDKAYAAWRESWQPFTQQPHLLFSEKRRRSPAYFTTGAGGALQSVLFGFLGLRLDYDVKPGSAWSKNLGDHWLSVKPNLPKEWKSVKLKNFSVGGQRYSLTATHRAATVVPGG